MNARLLSCLCVCLCLFGFSCSSPGTTVTLPSTDVVAGAQNLVGTVAAIQPSSTPEHFAKGATIRQEGDFDVNAYFEILTHLTVEPGYVLDYVYDYTGMGGRPVIYARPADRPAFASYEEYATALESTEAGSQSVDHSNDYLLHVRVDDTAEGYFELAMLRIMGDQFYLMWHAGYNDTTIVCDKESLEKAFSAVGASFTGVTVPGNVRKQAAKVDLRPTARLLDDGTATVRFITFSKWAGLVEIRYMVSRDFPHAEIAWDSRTLVEYDCGVMF